MYKIGFKFKVVKNGIVGEVDGVATSGIDGITDKPICSVCFYENGGLYYRADVFEDTITQNLKHGFYEEITNA